MPYCNKCGKEIPEGSLCSDCKTENLNSRIDKNNQNKWFLYGIIIFVVLIIAMFFTFKTGNVVNEDNSLKNCPYECCKESSGFEVKPCSDLYECKESKCIAIDSDGDGLTDIKEKEIGTDPNNPNTDGDRYDDKIDPNPLTPNSANINIVFTSKSWDWKYANLIFSLTQGANTIIAEPKANIEITNVGDDYTNFVDFNIIFKISNTIISQKQVHLNKFNVGDKYQETYVQPITVGDIPDLVINSIQQQTDNWGIEIQNLNYERFS